MKNKQPEFYVPGKNRHRRKHYWWRYLLVFILGQALVLPEFVLTLGTAATSFDAGTILTMLGLNKDDYLAEKYQGDNILTLIMRFASGSEKIESLGDIVAISPALDGLYEKYIEQYTTEYGININKDELFETKFSELGNYVKDVAMNTEIATVLSKFNLDVSSGIFGTLLYKVPVATFTAKDSNPITFDLSESTYELTSADFTVLPAKASNKGFEVVVDTEDVVTVSGTTLTAVAEGDALLTITPSDTTNETVVPFTVNVHVTNSPAPEVNPSDVEHVKGVVRDIILKEIAEGEKEGEGGEGGEGEEGGETHTDPRCAEGCVDENADGYCDNCHYLIKTPLTIQNLIDTIQGGIEGLIGDLTIGDIMNSDPEADLDPAYKTPSEEGEGGEGGESESFDILSLFMDLKIADLIKGDVDFMGILNEVKLSDLGMGGDDPIMRKLADKTIGDLMNNLDIMSLMEGIKLGSVLGISDDEANPLLKLVKDCVIAREACTCCEECDASEENGWICSHCHHEHTQEEIDLLKQQTVMEIFDTITIGQALGNPPKTLPNGDPNPEFESLNPLLKAMNDIMINGGDVAGQMQDAMTNVSIGELLGITEDDKGTLLYSLKDATLSADSIQNALDNMKLVDFISEGVMFSNNKLTGIWSLMFQDSYKLIENITDQASLDAAITEHGRVYYKTGNNYVEVSTYSMAYGDFYYFETAEEAARNASVTEMGSLMEGMADTIMNSTLYTLQEAGLISTDTDLTVATPGGGTLGDKTIEGLIELVTSLLSVA